MKSQARLSVRSINQSNRSISVRLSFLFCSRAFISRSYENRSMNFAKQGKKLNQGQTGKRWGSGDGETISRLGLITGHFLGNEPALLPRTDGGGRTKRTAEIEPISRPIFQRLSV